MPLINTALPNLLQGVSQQPDVLRYDGQCEIQENAVSSVLKGLQKRPPVEFISKLFNGEVGDEDEDILKEGFITFIERTSDEKYVVILDGVKLRVFRIELAEGSTTPTEASISVNGVNYTTGYPLTADDYIYSATSHQNIKALTIGDTTLMVNTATAVAKSGETTADLAEEALVFLKQGDYEKEYTITFGYPTVADVQYEVVSGSDSEASHASTSVIRDQFLNITPHAGGGGSTTVDMTGFATAVGESALLIDLSDSDLTVSGEQPTSISVSDGLSNNGLGLVYEAVDSITDLPKFCVNGFTVKVRGDAELTQDDYYVKFETNSGQSEGNGSWIESVGPSELYKFGSGTPVQLVNTTENTFVLRGMPFGERKAGDNNTNPFPSFVSNNINNIFLFKNRLGLLSRDAVIFSEAGFGGSANGTAYYVNSSGDGTHSDGHYYPLYLDSSVIYGDFTEYEFDAFPNTKFYMPDNNSNTAEVSAPTDPAILAFTDEGNITVATTIQAFNFFRTTVTDLLDSDPIDVTVSNREITNLRAAQPFQENLTIFSDTAQFVLKGGDLLTPRTVSISQVTNFDYTKTVEPLPLGSYLYFPFDRGNHTGLREYTINSTTDVYDSDEITQAVPQYIPNDLLSLTGSNSEGLIAAISGKVETTAGQVIDTSYVISNIQGTNHKFIGGGNLIYHTTAYNPVNQMIEIEDTTYTDFDGASQSRTNSHRFPNFTSSNPEIKGFITTFNNPDNLDNYNYDQMTQSQANDFGWIGGSLPYGYKAAIRGIRLLNMTANPASGYSTFRTAMGAGAYTIETFVSVFVTTQGSVYPFAVPRTIFEFRDSSNNVLLSAGYYNQGSNTNSVDDGKAFITINGTEFKSQISSFAGGKQMAHFMLVGDGDEVRIYINNLLFLSVAVGSIPTITDSEVAVVTLAQTPTIQGRVHYSRIYNYKLPSTQRTINFNSRFN